MLVIRLAIFNKIKITGITPLRKVCADCQQLTAPRLRLRFRKETFCPHGLTAQVLLYLSVRQQHRIPGGATGCCHIRAEGIADSGLRGARSRSLRGGARLRAKLGCSCERCCWHAWAFLAARAGRGWKASVAAEGGPVCLDSLPAKQAVPAVPRVCAGGRTTHPGSTATKATALAVFHCCCLLSGEVHVASVGYRGTW